MTAQVIVGDIQARSAGLPISIVAPIDVDARLLFVVATYPGEARRVSAHAGMLTRLTLWLLDAASLGRLRDYRGMYRDHYANPRNSEYMLGAILAVEKALALRSPPAVIVPDGVATGSAGNISVTIVDIAEMDAVAWRRQIASGPFDAVVIVWPDAIGLGNERMQRRLLEAGAPVYVLNGRRRLFRLDPAMRWKIALRRYFAHTRVMELAFAAVVWPLAGLCALVDILERRRDG